jgi:hypothetical protein
MIEKYLITLVQIISGLRFGSYSILMSVYSKDSFVNSKYENGLLIACGWAGKPTSFFVKLVA